MKIRYSARATRDLAAIHEYLLKRSPTGATNVMAVMYAAIEFIRRYPAAAEMTRIPQVHAKIVRRYRFKIFYRVLAAEDTVEIIHVRHTSRRPWSGADD